MTMEAVRSEAEVGAGMRLEAHYDPRLALRKKQVQLSSRPIIQIHTWFARMGRRSNRAARTAVARRG